MAPATGLMRSAASPGVARALGAASSSAIRTQPALALAAASRAPTSTRRTFTNFPQSSSPSSGAPSNSIFGLPSASGPSGTPTSYFQRPSLPANTIVRFVPQQTAWIVERMGKFNRILQPGLAVLIPFLDRIAYVKSLKEAAIEIPSQSAITADNVTLELDGVLYTRVFDAYKASYGVEDAEYAISQLAQTTMRSEIGQLTLDHVLKERANLNANITAAINEAAQDWGKRAEILESEGQRQSAINIAEGRKQSVILASEALRAEQINMASGEAEAILLKAQATASGIDAVARAIEQGKQNAQSAVSLKIAEQYVDAFGKLAKEGTSVVVPGNVGDIGSMIATAMSVYGKVSEGQAKQVASRMLGSGEGSSSSTHASDRVQELERQANELREQADDVQQSVLESFENTTQKR
ncbi:erythrocyte band 7 integral membrane protein [Macrophomina phaseolina]|uniref:Erythrocyte band 7 integral membrane protein n=1 Tax=Macrophomina phaseolina TaxID=35725 RepID=A0ABQ8G792_9PEZI|nr:erythrocyte band 7 integral membrane protein [Macrophomina phaseolina]